ncbi:hypothetical protein GQ43DRAFT_461464 [Delitschia confertaspora ATCC 74209]|uniref:BTB domain-containing protein n=1 Tax=Delitschia confertaspora ATCC 74209 TaxID=1513339 RepID=A0A9P4JPU8_9PLEO|nr:hypothetical protein GQ43DRAFT_461464 [Delitschia confertaspora ATCC 74209]
MNISTVIKEAIMTRLGDEEGLRRAPVRPEDYITIDPDGDLEISALTNNGTASKIFLVSSANVRLAVPKWKALLDAAKSPVAGNKYQLDLEEDDIGTLRIILSLAHYQYWKVPDRLNFEELVKVMRFCQRHETTRFLIPWLQSSLSLWLPKLLKPGYELWLLVAYQLRYWDTLELIVAEIAVTMYQDDEEDWVVPRGTNLSKSDLPKCIMDNLLRLRTSTIQAILTECHDCIEDLSSGSPKIYPCRAPHDRERCACISLGSLLRSFKDLGIWPQRPGAQDIKMSAREFQLHVMNIDILTAPGHEDINDYSDGMGLVCPVREYFRNYVCLAGTRVEVFIAPPPAELMPVGGFQIPWQYSLRHAPAVWSHHSTNLWGFRERDVRTEGVDSESEDDEDYVPGKMRAEPLEEYVEYVDEDVEEDEQTVVGEDEDQLMVDAEAEEEGETAVMGEEVVYTTKLIDVSSRTGSSDC